MQIYPAFAALIHVQSFILVTAAPLTATPFPLPLIVDTESQRPSDQALALLPSPLSGNSTALRPFFDSVSPSKSNTTLISPQGLTPYHVKGSATTLFFHSFGAKIPSSYLLQCLSLSLTLVFEAILHGKGKDPIANGLFVHTHVMPNEYMVTITVADFRESGKSIDYSSLKDTLSGIGDFVTEPRQGVTTLSYEVEVDGRGYVGTGHVDYEPVASGV